MASFTCGLCNTNQSNNAKFREVKTQSLAKKNTVASSTEPVPIPPSVLVFYPLPSSFLVNAASSTPDRHCRISRYREFVN
jgi:hypothetical protein